MKKVLNMADINDVNKARQKVGFRMGTANIFPLMAELQKRGVNLPEPQNKVLQ